MPKHRAPARHRAPRTSPGKALRTSLTLSTMAVVGTGLAVSGGAALGGAAGPEADDTGLTTATVTTPVVGSGDDAKVDTTALESRTEAVCVMCAESNPDDCHRRHIADWLAARGERVVHLLAPGRAREHVVNPQEELWRDD